eukprot:gene12466-8550_t
MPAGTPHGDRMRGSTGTGTTAVWGKRHRGSDGATEAVTRFSELTTEQKAQRRKEERLEKKERERTMAYFMAAQRTLQPGATDPIMLASAVDGFFQELVKLLRADPSFCLLRNVQICQTIEMALRNALLLHSKTLLFVFLGHVPTLITSPVASYVFETLLASISQGLSGLATSVSDAEGNSAALEEEMRVGGQGIHTGSGIPSTATLLSHALEELGDMVETLLTHDAASRTTRSVILMLGGLPIRGAPPPHPAVRFQTLLGPLAEKVMHTVESWYRSEYHMTDAGEIWLTAVQTPSTSILLQSLLRVSSEGTRVDDACRQYLERLTYRRAPLLQELLLNGMGCHVFQSFLQVPTPAALCVEGDDTILAVAAAGRCLTPDEVAHLLQGCAWGRSLRMAQRAWGPDLAAAHDSPHAHFVLQDLARYAPSGAHLFILWREAFSLLLPVCWSRPRLGAALVALLRKAALDGAESVGPQETDGTQRSDDAAEAAAIQKDIGQGVRFFSVPCAIQRIICEDICQSLKAHQIDERRHAKGAAEVLLVQLAGATDPNDNGEAHPPTESTEVPAGFGPDVARYLLRFHPRASAMLQHSVEKLRVEDLQRAARHRKGSLVLQRYLHTAAIIASPLKNVQQSAETKTPSGSATLVHAEHDKSPAGRFFRRVYPFLIDWVQDTYAGYVVEALYDTAPLAIKEGIVQCLRPLLDRTNKPELTTREADTPEAKALRLRTVIAKKVLQKCCVEQYAYRPDEWRKLAQRQFQVRQLMGKMTLP